LHTGAAVLTLNAILCIIVHGFNFQFSDVEILRGFAMSPQPWIRRLFRQIQSTMLFAIGMCAVLFAGGLVLLLFSKASVHLCINGFHTPVLDAVFTYATLLGDGISATILVLVLCFVRYRYALMTAVSNILCSVLVQSLKRLVFADSVRPYQFFKGVHELYLVPGVEVYSYNSFPSGHSATVFTSCVLLCLFTERRSAQILLLLLACVTAFSRVYLSQHFFADVYAGAAIGVVAGYATASFLNIEIDSSASWLDKSFCGDGRNAIKQNIE
jgi:membrane-associated phospholipid phosphatase